MLREGSLYFQKRIVLCQQKIEKTTLNSCSEILSKRNLARCWLIYPRRDTYCFGYKISPRHVLTTSSCFMNLKTISTMFENDEKHEHIEKRVLRGTNLKLNIENYSFSCPWFTNCAPGFLSTYHCQFFSLFGFSPTSWCTVSSTIYFFFSNQNPLTRDLTVHTYYL